MRTRAICLLAAAASALGIISPFITGMAVDSDFKSIPFVYWFYWLPGLVTYWIDPESDSAFMAVSMAVYAVQYLALFGVIWSSTRAAAVVLHFINPHRHRGGLVRRRT
jgi:hypothetical protein